MGRMAKISDLEAVKDMFETVVKAKGGTAKLVVSMD